MFKLFLILLLLSLTILATENKQLNNVSVRLQWKNQFQFAGFYIAKEKGYYKDKNINLTIKEYEIGKDVTKEVISQKVNFGTNYQSVILNKDVMLLSAILQVSPHILVSLESSNINSIKDFKNKRIMLGGDSTKTASFIAMIKSQQLSFTDMKILKHSYDIKDLIEKKTDIISLFSSNDLFKLDKLGIKYKLWDSADYGFGFYDLIIFTSQKYYKKNPKIVRDFRSATLKGYEYAFNNIEETVNLILKKYNTQNKSKEALIYEAKVLKKLAHYQKEKIGNINKNKILRIYDVYNFVGITKSKKIDFNLLIFNKKDFLNQEEKKWLSKERTISYVYDPDWAPFEWKNEIENHSGIISDIINIISKKTGIKFIPINTQSWSDSIKLAEEGKVDMYSAITINEKRKKYMNFTDNIFNYNAVFVKNRYDKKRYKSLKNIKIIIVKDSALGRYIKKKYPSAIYNEVVSTEDGFKKIRNKEANLFVINIATANYYILNKNYDDLVIAKKLEYYFAIKIGISKKLPNILLSIINKTLKTISEEEKNRIYNKWIKKVEVKKIVKEIDWFFLFKIFLLISFFILILIIYNMKLKSEVKKKTQELKYANSDLKEELKKRNNELENRNDELEKLKEAISSYVIMTKTDLNGVIIEASDQFCEISGYSKKELIGASQNIVRHPDVNKEVFISLWKKISNGKTFSGILKNKAKNGDTFICKSFIFPNFDNNGDIISYTGFRLDITDKVNMEKLNLELESKVEERTTQLKDSYKALKHLNHSLEQTISQQNFILSLLEKGGVLLIGRSKSRKINYISGNIEKMLGYSKNDLLTGRVTDIDVVSSKYLIKIDEMITQAIKNDVNYVTYPPYEIKTKSNEIKWIIESVLIKKGRNGDINLLSYMFDITSVRELEEENFKQKELLQQQSKMAMMGEMIGAIAHQWRQPLNALSIHIQNLELDFEDEIVDLEYIHKFTEKNMNTILFMSKTIDDFRNFFSSTKTKIDFSIKESIEETISLVSAQFKDKNIQIILKGDDFNITNLKSEFQQVILNIINNARDALLDNNIDNKIINIVLYKNSIIISDNGGGIPKNVINRIFEPYYTTKEQGKGTGIGLYMSKIIIENNMGGKLSVRNILGGSEFTIILPTES